MPSPVVALKALTVKAWIHKECKSCGKAHDIEQKHARMAPAAMLVVADTEAPFAVMDPEGHYRCPFCKCAFQDQKAAHDGESSLLGKAKNKKIELTLLVHPDWLKGSPGKDSSGRLLGGSVTDAADATIAWNHERARTLKLIEVRGKLPETIVCPDNGELFNTTKGNVPRKATFACTSCGKLNKVSEALASSKRSAPVSVYVQQGYCPACDEERQPYGGRFFAVADHNAANTATKEWSSLKEGELSPYWPRTAVLKGLETSARTPLHKYNYHRWADFFNDRQLIGHARILKCIAEATDNGFSIASQEAVLGTFQQFLRNQCMFSFWHIKLDKLAPFLSNNNFHPRSTVIEVGTFAPMGYGPWTSTLKPLLNGTEWKNNPWDLVAVSTLPPELAANAVSPRA